jgi:hypothetical protein
MSASKVTERKQLMRKIILLLMVALAALALSATAAFAYTGDPATGKGFVGKGEVQTAFNWNNDKLQKNAGGVSFSYITTDNYSAVCTWTTGEGTRGEKTHDVSHTTTTQVNDEIAYEARQVKGQKQITGFNLTGLGATSETGTVPVVGGACPGNEGTDGTWSSVTQTGSTGGLYVNSPGLTSILLTPTPTL